jgi:hypothetical protein
MHRHPTLTAWNREEDGSYRAEIDGWTLDVTFRPEKDGERRGFSWTATGPEDRKLSADGVQEEMEDAMADAEHAAKEAASAMGSSEGASSEPSDEGGSDGGER